MWIKFETDGAEMVAAEYSGGAYVELYFGGHPIPSDVINVWDYEKGAPAHNLYNPLDLTRVVWEWVNETAEEDPGWYEDYLANLP